MITEEQARQAICEATGAEYIGKLRITKEDGFYNLYLYLEQYERPRLVISMETEDDEAFMKFICEEMRIRKMNIVKFWRLDKLESKSLIQHE